MALWMFGEPEDFFHGSQKKTPKCRTKIIEDGTNKWYDTEAMAKFFGKDLLSMLGQGPINNPVRKIKKTVEEPLSEEEVKIMKELWGDDYMEFKM